MSVLSYIALYLKKNATKIVAPISVLLFVGLVVVYDISLPTLGAKNKDMGADCEKTAIDDPVYSLNCEDDTLLDLEFESAAARFATNSIYDSDLVYILPTQSDMTDELITAHGSIRLVADASLLDFPEEGKLYLYHPENSASWRNVWLAADGATYTLDAYMVPSTEGAGKLHAILAKELDGIGTLLEFVDTSFKENFTTQDAYTTVIALELGSCALVTLVQKNNIVVSAVSREKTDCDSIDYAAHIYLTSLVVSRADSLTSTK